MKLGTRIVAIAIGSIVVTTTAALFVQRAVIREQGINSLRDTMRVALLSAENTRSSISAMRSSRVFDDQKLVAEVAQAADFHDTAAYGTIPVVAAWNSIRKVADQEGYAFRVPADHPRNPKNMPSPEEERILTLIAKDHLSEYFAEDDSAGEVTYAAPSSSPATALPATAIPPAAPPTTAKTSSASPWKTGTSATSTACSCSAPTLTTSTPSSPPACCNRFSGLFRFPLASPSASASSSSASITASRS